MIGDEDRLLTTAEVAWMFGVNRKTPSRWRKAGKLSAIRTPGGHLRYSEAKVRALLKGDGDGDEG